MKTPRPRERPGRGEPDYLVEAGAAFLCFLCFFEVFGASAEVLEADAESAAIGAAFFGMSAAIAPAARPMVKKAETIKIPDLFIAAPAVGRTTGRKNTLVVLH